MPIPSSSTTLRLPAGFKNLLEGLALEVLRAQPADVVAFAAQHFQKLLEQREGEWSGPARPRVKEGCDIAPFLPPPPPPS
uniref:RIIa domain-containing protein n=1 Tax=Accipiter nisus TaxID=211598 RepID=A0A8B9M0G5_9AVES